MVVAFYKGIMIKCIELLKIEPSSVEDGLIPLQEYMFPKLNISIVQTGGKLKICE